MDEDQKTDHDIDKTEFEFGIVGTALQKEPKVPFLKSLSRDTFKLPDLRPMTVGAFSPTLKTSRDKVIGHQIDLEAPPRSIVDLYGVTSLVFNPKLNKMPDFLQKCKKLSYEKLFWIKRKRYRVMSPDLQ